MLNEWINKGILIDYLRRKEKKFYSLKILIIKLIFKFSYEVSDVEFKVWGVVIMVFVC